MTDKKEFDQEELNVAFEQLNQNDGLEPTAELDAMILKMAAEELTSDAVEEKSKVTDISEISFRRGQRESHKALKKKGMFPKWVMPMGLAATVLLSFGVVNRVLMSPEFDNVAKQSSYEVLSDEAIITSAPDSKVLANKDDLSLNKPARKNSAQLKKLKSITPNATVTVNGNEMNADISFADAPLQAPVEPSPPALENISASPVGMSVGARQNDEEMARAETSAVEIEADLQADREQLQSLIGSKKEQHALLAKEKRERLTQAMRRDEPDMQMAPIAGYRVPETAPQISSAGTSIGSVGATEEVMVANTREDKNSFEAGAAFTEPEKDAISSLSESESVEEAIITGARIKTESDTSDFAMSDGDDLAEKAAEAKTQVIQTVLFEHKQCHIKQDCALVALTCDSCECLDALNQESYSKYTSDFTQTEIAEQCIEMTADCVRNYCQVQQAE